MKKFYLALIIAVLAISILPACTTQSTPQSMGSYTDITPQEAKMLIDENPDLVVIDVSPAYAEGHLPGAVSYPVGDGTLDNAIPMLDKNGKYLVYCHLESASRLGAQKLVDAASKPYIA
jgi:rhodanese-related sulfurtransferase